MPAGTIRKRETKQGTRWQAIVDLGPDPVTGKRRQRSKFCDTEREAKRALAQLLVQADRGQLSVRTGQSVADLCQHWLDTEACFKAPKTFEEYERTIRLHITPHLGKMKAQSLTTLQVRSWISGLLKAGKGHRTVQLSLLRLHQVLGRAAADGILPYNATMDVHVPAPEDRGREMSTWTDDEAQRFLDATAHHTGYGPIWYVSLTTGMRRGELLGLRWKDIDWDNTTLRVRQTVGMVRSHITIKPVPKSRKSRRDILVDQSVIDALRDHRTQQMEERLRVGPAWHDNDLVFPSDVGTPIHPSNLWRQYKTIIAEAGVPYIRIHDQRHTHVTWALEEGADLKAVSERVGHASTRITADLYQHVTRKLQVDVVTKVAGKLARRTV